VRFRATSLIWGAFIAGGFIYLYSPAMIWALHRLGFGFEAGLSQLALLPSWHRVLIVIIGGTVEEVLYRGYAMNRLTALTGNIWLAGTISSIVFGLVHAPMWGLGPAAATVVSGALLAALYGWRQDLWANVVGHIITDIVGIFGLASP